MFRNRILVTVATALTIVCAFPYTASAQMSDEEIVEYIKQANAEGKTQNQIAKELIAKGVKTTKLQSLKTKYDSVKDIKSRSLGQSVETRKTGRLNDVTLSDEKYDAEEKEKNAEYSEQKELASRSENGPRLYMTEGSAAAAIYGHDVFRSQALSFEPNDNMPTPANYKLGPGDVLSIDVWGTNEANLIEEISQEGRIIISQIGPIYLNGLTIEQAGNKIKKLISQKYSGIEGAGASGGSVTLAKIRTIQVNVLGDVAVPGTYRLSAFATLFNAIYRAGGISGNGSLRNIQLIRGGKVVATSDLYEFLFDGNSDDTIRIEDGDVIMVPPFKAVAMIDGNVKRPMSYEIVEGETMADLIRYAGGFTSDAYTANLNVQRKTGKEYRILSVTDKDYGSFKLEDGDAVKVEKIVNRYENKVEIKGSVFHPGEYELGRDIATVRQLIEHASGLTEDAYLDRAMLLREKEDLTLEVEPVNLKDVMNGKDDILLRRNDVLLVSNKREIVDEGTITIVGYVNRPGEFPFAANTTVYDAILQAGGLLNGASVAKVDVARRTSNPGAKVRSASRAESFTFSIDGSSDEAEKFFLEPYDMVIVHKNPDYRVQEFVNVEGEVAFEGDYVLTTNNFRLSDLISACGGITSTAYPHGARLIRHMTEDEIATHTATLEMIYDKSQKDSIAVNDRMLSATYTVGIDLEKALKDKGSVYDIILRDGDKLVVPEYNSTVKIQGSVMYPNTVSYLPNKSLHYYIEQAGGFSYRAKRSGVYVVYMNGNVAKIHNGSKVEPGCEIIIPSKPTKKQMSTSEWLSIGTTAASLSTMVATLINLIK